MRSQLTANQSGGDRGRANAGKNGRWDGMVDVGAAEFVGFNLEKKHHLPADPNLPMGRITAARNARQGSKWAESTASARIGRIRARARPSSGRDPIGGKTKSRVARAAPTPALRTQNARVPTRIARYSRLATKPILLQLQQYHVARRSSLVSHGALRGRGARRAGRGCVFKVVSSDTKKSRSLIRSPGACVAPRRRQ